MCARMAAVARRSRSWGSRVPLGSTSRAKRRRKPARAPASISSGVCRLWAVRPPTRPQELCCEGLSTPPMLERRRPDSKRGQASTDGYTPGGRPLAGGFPPGGRPYPVTNRRYWKRRWLAFLLSDQFSDLTPGPASRLKLSRSSGAAHGPGMEAVARFRCRLRLGHPDGLCLQRLSAPVVDAGVVGTLLVRRGHTRGHNHRRGPEARVGVKLRRIVTAHSLSPRAISRAFASARLFAVVLA
jgi:hypothetical protein